LLDHDISGKTHLGRALERPLRIFPRGSVRMTMMADETPTDEKSYRDWLAEALARDEQTWAALEEKLKLLRVRRDNVDFKKKILDC
jgi:hypothetical protein